MRKNKSILNKKIDNVVCESELLIKDTRPWVEKYRPSSFEDIVLDDVTRKLLQNIIERRAFPNILLYGPPGTGKTTTIVNLVDKYRKNIGETGAGMVIHLNASDERGVDIVRGPLSQFAKSGNMFNKGTKFVILDEADYMTAQAQFALRQLIQSHPHIKFCLICNYVSKVETSLRNEFVRIRFNHLPPHLIDELLLEISRKEKLGFSNTDVEDIRTLFGSDIRSMINFIQSSYDSTQQLKNVIRRQDMDLLYSQCLSFQQSNNSRKLRVKLNATIKSYCGRGYDPKHILRSFVHYLLTYKESSITDDFLKKIEFIIHHNITEIDVIISYFIDACCSALSYDNV